MIIGIINEILSLYASIFYVHSITALLFHVSPTMMRNYKMFGNTSIIAMVGKVILEIKIMLNIGERFLYF